MKRIIFYSVVTILLVIIIQKGKSNSYNTYAYEYISEDATYYYVGEDVTNEVEGDKFYCDPPAQKCLVYSFVVKDSQGRVLKTVVIWTLNTGKYTPLR